MPIAVYFDEQLAQLRIFMEFPFGTLRLLRHDPDLRPMMLRMLAGLDQQPDNPHVMLPCTTPFRDRGQYARELLAEVVTATEACRAALAETGVVLPMPGGACASEAPEARFVAYVSAVAERLPARSIGSLVIVIAPEEIGDEAAFAATIAYFAAHTRSRWAKYIVLDRRQDPMLGDLHERNPRVSQQTFHLSEFEIERRVTDALSRRELSAAEQLRYASMLARFHLARRDFSQAAALLRTSIDAARAADSPRDLAASLYDLGNAHLGQEAFAEAERCYAEAVDICIAERLDGLLAMVLTNLGVALQRQGRDAEAAESFAAARRLYAAQNDPTGQGYVLDSEAEALFASGRTAEAETRWHEAIRVYGAISSPQLHKLRDASRAGAVDKLRRLYHETGQRDKLATLPAPAEECVHG